MNRIRLILIAVFLLLFSITAVSMYNMPDILYVAVKLLPLAALLLVIAAVFLEKDE